MTRNYDLSLNHAEDLDNSNENSETVRLSDGNLKTKSTVSTFKFRDREHACQFFFSQSTKKIEILESIIPKENI